MSGRRSKRRSFQRGVRAVFFTAVLAAAALVEYRFGHTFGDPAAFDPPAALQAGGKSGLPASASAANPDTIEAAYADQRSGFMVEAAGDVVKVLSDDHEGARHQRFLVRLPSGQTVLIAHNIDLAKKVPLARGDPVAFRGQYEWNERGGVIHWTHRDPDGRHAEGWIEFHGRRYE
jgi:hypothetical protein